MNEDKNNLKEGVWWRPVMVFYAKTTSWVIFPLVIAVLVSKFTNFGQDWFFVLVMAGFAITCLGIYREIKEYKKQLALPVDELRPREQNEDKDGNK